MLRRALLPLTVIALIGTGARAADLPPLPPPSRLGAEFAQPYIAAEPRHEITSHDYPLGVYAPQVDIQPLVNGYYGKPNSFYYRPYYGIAADTYTRLPYACGFFGYC